MDASSSYDENVDLTDATSAKIATMSSSFSYDWKCIQIEPTFSSNCGLDMKNMSSNAAPKLSLQAIDSTPGM